jgi:hypothetical protein
MRAFTATSDNSNGNRQQQQQQQQRLKLTVPRIAQIPQHAAAAVLLPARPPAHNAIHTHNSFVGNSGSAVLQHDDTPRHSHNVSTVRAASIGGVGGAAGVIAFSKLKDKLIATNNSNSTTDVSTDSISSSANSMSSTDRNGAWSWSERLKLVPSYSKLRKYSYIQQIGTGNHGNVILVKQVCMLCYAETLIYQVFIAVHCSRSCQLFV